MAKIVPRGYADIGAYDERDDYMEILELLGGIAGTYQTVKTNYEKNMLDSLNASINNIDKIHSAEGFNILTASMKKYKDDIYKTGNPELQLIADQAFVIASNYTSDFGNYEKQFSNIVAMQENPDGIFNPKNLTVQNIMSWDPEKLNQKYGEVEKIRAQFFKSDGVTPKFDKYEMGGTNSSVAAMSLNNFYKQLSMAFSSLEGSKIISKEEAEYILRADATGLQKLRTNNLNHAKERIKFYESQGLKSQGIGAKLKEKQDKSIFDLSKEDPNIMAFMENNRGYMDEIDLELADLSYTTEQIQNEEASPKAEQLYQHLIEQADLLELKATQDKGKYIGVWDYWSPVLWGDDMSKMPDERDGSWDAGAENNGEPKDTVGIPDLTPELAKAMYNTFEPAVKKQWEAISSDEVEDSLKEHQYEYPEDSGNWYNHKDIYNMVIGRDDDKKDDKVSNLLYNQLDSKQEAVVQQWYVKEGLDNIWGMERADWWDSQTEEYKQRKLGLLKETEGKEKETTISDFMDNILIDVTKINQDERKYIKSKIGSYNWSPALTLVRRYKMAKDDSERQKIKSQIEKLLL